jgi:hypothetical protein
LAESLVRCSLTSLLVLQKQRAGVSKKPFLKPPKNVFTRNEFFLQNGKFFAEPGLQSRCRTVSINKHTLNLNSGPAPRHTPWCENNRLAYKNGKEIVFRIFKNKKQL